MSTDQLANLFCEQLDHRDSLPSDFGKPTEDDLGIWQLGYGYGFVQCPKCCRQSDMMEASESPISGILPAEVWQCPKCGYAWKMAYVTDELEDAILRRGKYPPNKIPVPVQAYL